MFRQIKWIRAETILIYIVSLSVWNHTVDWRFYFSCQNRLSEFSRTERMIFLDKERLNSRRLAVSEQSVGQH